MIILVIDINNPQESLRNIAEQSGYDLGMLQQAWHRQEQGMFLTDSINEQSIFFDYKHMVPEKKAEDIFLEKKVSYVAAQKQLPKFLKKKRY